MRSLPILRRRRHTIDDTLRLNLSVQRQTIETLSARIDQVQAQADRQDTALTEQGSRIADIEALISDLVWLVGWTAARGRPVLCLKCRTAYATTGLRWTGHNLVLVCPVCGPMTWKRP